MIEFHTPTPLEPPQGEGGCGSGVLSKRTTPTPHPHTAGLSEYDHPKLSDETAALIVARLIEHWRQKP